MVTCVVSSKNTFLEHEMSFSVFDDEDDPIFSIFEILKTAKL